LTQARRSLFGSYYSYKYNGKELQETGMYDYGARMMMPDLGRWGIIDAMSEKYSAWSPYNYAINNPVMVIDPDGNDAMFASGEAAQAAFRVYVATMSTSTDSSGGNIFTGFGRSPGEDPDDPKPGFWGSIGNFFSNLLGHNKKNSNRLMVGPAEEISEERFAKRITTWQVVSALLFNSTDPYSAIGNMGVGPYAEERENVGMVAMLFVNPEAGAEGLERKLLTNILPVSTEGKLLGSIVDGKILMNGSTKASGTFDFVITESGKTLLGRKHTFLSKGSNVLAAGELKIRGGNIVNINNLSGHYLPGPDIANTYLDIFKAVNINVSKAHLKVYNSQGQIINHVLPK